MPMTPIPFNDLKPGIAALRDEIDAAIADVLDSGRAILGSQVLAFESEFAAYCGAAEGVGVASGTDALYLGLKALQVQPGVHRQLVVLGHAHGALAPAFHHFVDRLAARDSVGAASNDSTCLLRLSIHSGDDGRSRNPAD